MRLFVCLIAGHHINTRTDMAWIGFFNPDDGHPIRGGVARFHDGPVRILEFGNSDTYTEHPCVCNDDSIHAIYLLINNDGRRCQPGHVV